MEREIFLKLLSRKLASDISTAELQQLEEAANSQPELRQLEEQLTQYFKTKPHQPVDTTPQLEKVWEAIAVQEQAPQIKTIKINHFNGRNLLRYAATVLLLVVAGLVIRKAFYQKAPAEQLVTLSSGNQRLFLTLADGTQVWLNRQSAISYNSAFGQNQRRVVLKGEAFFDVAKNEAVPLTIDAGHVNIKVKGTAFNVNANEPAKNIEIALVRGAIEVTDSLHRSQGILLRPNHKLVFASGADIGHAQLLAMDLGKEDAAVKWTQDTLVFRKEKFKDLVLQMEIRYKVKIEIQNEQLKNRRFSGSFTNEPLKDALEALKLSYPFSYQITEQKVVIK